MDNLELLERLGVVEPPDLQVTARVAAVLEAAEGERSPKETRSRTSRRRDVLTSALAVVALIVGAVIVFGGGGLASPVTTPRQAGQPLFIRTGGSALHQRQGTWTLANDALTGTWQQNPVGPPSGYVSCPSPSVCFVMSGTYASDHAASAESESLYVSSDSTTSWTAYAMPSGFIATSPLSCSDNHDCAAGGTYKGQPVLVTTANGGNSYTISPLPSAVGNLYSLSCSTAQYCAGLAATKLFDNVTPEDATFLSTSNAGASFADSPIVSSDSMEQSSCSSTLDCTVTGVSDALGINDWTAGVSAVTTNGGQSWSAGVLPGGLGVGYSSELSCADALHCSVLGIIDIAPKSSPICTATGSASGTLTTATLPPQSPAVRAIAVAETQIASTAKLSSGSYSAMCSSTGAQTWINDIASSSDGGLTWTPEQLPNDVPEPQLSDITCPTATECWASGSDAVSQHLVVPNGLGGVLDGGSSVLLGTTNGGGTWSQVVFNVPANAPNFEGQSYMSVGPISCADANRCAAVGTTAQGSPNAPIYSLVIPTTGS